MRRLRRLVFARRLALWLVVAVALIDVASTTFAGVSSPSVLGRGDIDCGSPRDPRPLAEVVEAGAFDCEVRLDEARDRRVLALLVGGAALLVLAVLHEERSRRPERYEEPRPAAAPALDPPLLETERLWVRAARPEDVVDLVATMDDEMRDANGWTPAHVGTVAALTSGAARAPDGATPLLVMEVRADGRIAGGLSVTPEDDGPPELGLWLGPDHRGQGYGGEAVAALAADLARRGVPHLRAGTAVDNAAMRALLERLGGTVVGQGPRVLPDGRQIEAVTYELEVGGAASSSASST